MIKKTEIGKILKNKRLEQNLRMDDVAKEVLITRSTLWSIENGSGNYSIDILFRLLDFYNMSFNINSPKAKTNKLRASRISKTLDKKINRFIIMCVEQYALSSNKSSKSVYKALYEKGIIKELTVDYDDMHGMSTYSINEYIDKRLGKESKKLEDSLFSKEHVLAKTILIVQTSELIAKKYKYNIADATKGLYRSEVIEKLDDDETGLYNESAQYLLSLFEDSVEHEIAFSVSIATTGGKPPSKKILKLYRAYCRGEIDYKTAIAAITRLHKK